MYRFIIVDDESVVRTVLSTTIDWEAEGFHLVGSFSHGRSALEFLQENQVDLVLTDIKMPILDGLGLIRAINKLSSPPMVVVLSAYSEFSLVRKAFTLGVTDYILKDTITPKLLTSTAQTLAKQLQMERQQAPISPPLITPLTKEELLRDMLLENRGIDATFFDTTWYLACFEIDRFPEEALRFADNLPKSLVLPILNIAQDIPRIKNKCTFVMVSYSRYVLYFGGHEATVAEVQSICRQLQKVWHTYLNLSFSVGISEAYSDPSALYQAVNTAMLRTSFRFLFGIGGMYCADEHEGFSLVQAVASLPQHKKLVQSVAVRDDSLYFTALQDFYAMLYGMPLAAAKQVLLQIVYSIAQMLHTNHTNSDTLWHVVAIAPGETIYQTIMNLQDMQSTKLWFSGFATITRSHLQNANPTAEPDVLERAKHFIAANYTHPDITIVAVAEHVGLSEKYFSTIFNERIGVSFLSYVNQLRISMAKKLLSSTDMKMYEVGDSVGYNSVEQFSRVFKRLTGLTPTGYKNTSHAKLE